MGQWQLLATRPGGTVTCLASTGCDVLAATPAGLRRSIDGGLTWMVVGGPRVPAIEVVVSSTTLTSDAALLAGTADGLLRSMDGGRTWQPALVGSRILAIAFSPAFAHDGLVLVGTEQDGILRSDNRGHTWTGANPGLLDLTVLGLACSPEFEADHTVFAATASGLFRSSNAGRTWRAIETLPGEPAVQCCAVSPRFSEDGVVVAATEADGLFRSTDGGVTWLAVEALAGRSVTALAWSSGDRLAAATDSGVLASSDRGATWSRVGSETWPALSVAFAPDGVLLAGIPRLGIVRSEDLVSWQSGSTGLQAHLGVALVLSPEFGRDQTVYLAGLEDGVAMSTDAGATWTSANAGLGSDTAVFGLGAAQHSLYAATSQGIFRCRCGTSDWLPVHPAPSRAVRANGQRVLAISMVDGLLASSDNGASWQPLPTPACAGHPTSIALAGSSTSLVGTVLRATGAVAVWRTTDGQDWRRLLLERTAGVVTALASPTDNAIFAGLGDAVFRPVPSFVERAASERRPVWRRVALGGTVSALETSTAYRQDRTLLAATSKGVYVSRDGGATFQMLGADLADVPSVAVAFSPDYHSDRLIYVVELGGRIWRHRET